MIKVLSVFGDVKNFRRTNNNRGKPLLFCFFDLETGEEIMRIKRLFKDIKINSNYLEMKMSKETENFLNEWHNLQKEDWRKKLMGNFNIMIAPEMN